MRNEIYVGALISERELEHSSGPWKKHKYLKKIGDKYIYAKNKVGEAADIIGDKISDTAENVVDKARDLAFDAQFEAEWKAGRAKDAVENAADAVKEKVGEAVGADERAKWISESRKANNRKEWADDAKKKGEAARRSGEKDDGFYKDWEQRHRKEYDYQRERARKAHADYSKTAMGKAENALESIKKKVTRRSRLKEASKQDRIRSQTDSYNAGSRKAIADSWNRAARSNQTITGDVMSRENRASTKNIANYYAEKSKQDARNSTTRERLRAARQSELERTSLKGRSERAKKRIKKALQRLRKK